MSSRILINSLKNLPKMKNFSSTTNMRNISHQMSKPAELNRPAALKTVLHGVTTGTPKYSASQKEMFELLINKPSIKKQIGDERLNNLLTKTKIDHRYFAFSPLDYVNKTLSYDEKKKIIKEVGGNLAISVAR